MSDEEDTVEAGQFAPTFPIWVLFRERLRAKTPESKGVVPFRPLSTVDAHPLLLFFSSESLAKSFIGSVGISDLEALAVETPRDFGLICRFHLTQGTKAIAVDLAAPDGTAQEYLIENVNKRLQNP